MTGNRAKRLGSWGRAVCGLVLAAALLLPLSGDCVRRGVPVLLYHQLLTCAENTGFVGNGSVISVEEFSQQMAWLHDNGFQSVSCRQLLGYLYDREALPDKSVLITFDDGYAGVARYAAPLLKQYGYTAVVFVSLGLLQAQPEPWDPDRLQMLDRQTMSAFADVFEYYSHSASFHQLDGNGEPLMLSQDVDSLRTDTEANKVICDGPELYAYPYGRFSPQMPEILSGCGVRAAFTVRQGYASRETSPWQIGRFIVFPGTSEARFRNYMREVRP